MASQFEMYQNVVPLVAPIDGTTGTVATGYLDMGTFHRGTLFIYFGVVTSTTDTDTVTVTLECSSASTSDASEEAIPFQYRLSGTVAIGNTWGAVGSATSAGLSLGASTVFDGKCLGIDIDPSVFVGHMPEAKYVRAQVTPSAAYSVMLYSAFAVTEPRYRQTTMVVATVT